jgi:two-component system chemotaxis sensor kinase CheA
MDDLLGEFLTETTETLSVLDTELVRLEQQPNDPELLGNIFRLVHTVKGTCGFLGLPRLEAVAHAGENILGKFRDGELEVNPEAVTLILECIDTIKDLLGALERTEKEPDGDDAGLIARLNAVANGEAAAPRDAAPSEVAPSEVESSPPAKAEEEPGGEADNIDATGTGKASLFERLGNVPVVDDAVDLLYAKALGEADLHPFFKGVDIPRLNRVTKEFLAALFSGHADGGDSQKAMRAALGPVVAKGFDASRFKAFAEHLREALCSAGAADEAAAEAHTVVIGCSEALLSSTSPQPQGAVADADKGSAAPEEKAAKKPETNPEKNGNAARGPSVARQSIRVNVDLLETLMTMVSELVLTRNQLLQMVRGQTDNEFAVPLQRLSHITTELQEGVMKTRMQPIGNAWAKLPRIVRDLALDLGKKIDLKMIGADTELDRQVLELIKDPLTHMVRNSADHGLEMGEDRLAAGKPETGKIVLNAFHEGGHIVIEISDDGKGLSREKIKAKALENGLATEAELDSMTDQHIMRFIFNPGFSTATLVTNVSGRGVGLDVVRSNIEKIGGTVDLCSEAGKGTRFVIKIPLTLAIVSALIVECGGERFAIPQISVVELVRASSRSEHRIEEINNTPVLRLRNRLLPLVSLHDLLRLEHPEAKTRDETFIVVAQVGTYSFGIIVDRVFDTEEIVVKPVSPILRDISLFAGNTILGDGSVIMILDPNGIAAATGQIAISDEQADEEETNEGNGEERVALLVFRAGSKVSKAVPLSLIARLEEVEVDKIEYSNERPVVQYRGKLMPLVTIDPSQRLKEEGRQGVLVFSEHNRTMGLVVDEIVDIVEDRMAMDLSSGQPGVLGSAIIEGRATEVVDASHYLTQAFGDWFTATVTPANGDSGRRRVLLVDDSPFFRNLLLPLLSVAGYEVTSVESANEALELREAGENFDAIISDIEMPGMDGFEFARTVKNEGRWRQIPMLALSSHTSKKDLERGREVGFHDYVAKLDREGLLQSLNETLDNLAGAA